MPHAPDHPPALAAARKAVAGARAESGSLLALILALLMCLFARRHVARPLLEDQSLYGNTFLHDPRAHADTDFDIHAVLGTDPYALVLPPMGRAPHAACIEAGLVPDWILPGIRNRGMRPHARPTGKKPSPLGGLSREADQEWVRGPPRPYAPKNTPQPGASTRAKFVTISL